MVPDTVLNYLQALSHLILKLMLHSNSETDPSGGWRKDAKSLVQESETSPAFSPSEDGA